MHAHRLFLAALSLVAGVSVFADVTLAPVFTDHAVLQRDKPLPVWGQAEPGEHVVVTFGERTGSATAGADGRWIVFLDPVPASTQPAELVVEGKNAIRLTDIVVGDVWLLSGQSNMEWPVERAQNAPQEIAAANFPLIRHLKIKRTVAQTPAHDVVTEGGWRVSSPDTTAGFSAVGFFFARDLQPRLGVPIGLLNSSWGGTPVEAWMSPAALESAPDFAVVKQRWEQVTAEFPVKKAEHAAALAAWSAEQAAATAKGEKFSKPRPRGPLDPKGPFTPSGLFNGMINPLLPVGLRGVLWYQGETNTSRASEYRALFSAMIEHWRKHLGQGDVPFFWVQLANFRDPGDPSGITWAFLREAQTQTLALPMTGQAVTIDIGDPGDIHPRNKQEVGRRLALIARAKVYDNSVDYTGPVFESATPEDGAVRVRFKHASTGLIARGKPAQSFEVAGADKVFYRATAKLDRDSVLVSAPEVKEPVAVRYAWSNSPEANLFNGAGLPAVPFRSDSW
jgi:sialate O-acetylesterase